MDRDIEYGGFPMKRRHPNAQDLLAKSKPFLSQGQEFHLAYPQVEFLDLEVKAEPKGFGDRETYHYSLQNPPGNYCPCPNPNCTGGGFNMGALLNRLISSKETSGEASGPCVGHEGMNRAGSRSCYYMFKVSVKLRYSDQL